MIATIGRYVIAAAVFAGLWIAIRPGGCGPEALLDADRCANTWPATLALLVPATAVVFALDVIVWKYRKRRAKENTDG